MATDDKQVQVVGAAPAPATWTVPGNGQIRPKVVTASYNGSGAGSAFYPAIKIVSDAGIIVGVFRTGDLVAAGASALVTWFPDVDESFGSTPTPVSSGITALSSPVGTISIGNATGPAATVDLATTAVTPGTYGDSSHVSEVTIDADGRVTSATSVPIAGGSGTIGFEVGYDQITAAVNIASTTEATGTTIIAGSAHTFDGAPVLAEFFSPLLRSGTTSGSQTTCCLFEGATEIGRLVVIQTPTSGQSGGPVTGHLRFTPSAASHTYSVTAFATSLTGTPLVNAGTGGTGQVVPAFLRFTKV